MRHYDDTIYYSDLENDDFGQNNITLKDLPKHYKYINNNIFSLLIDFVIYRIVARPIAYLYNKLRFHQKIINKKVLKKSRGGYFLYSNHTGYGLDAFTPNILGSIRKNYIVVGEETASLRKILPLLKSLGALPLSSEPTHMKQLLKAMGRRSNHNSITIFPEAHIWPYYNKIRKFPYTSFKYPVKFNKPVFTITNCYKKRLFGKRPRVLTFVDGPFLPDKSLPNNEAAIKLRDQAYNIMNERATKYSTYEYYNYEYVENSKK